MRASCFGCRLAPSDARYGNGLVAGAKVMEIFGDLETEIAIREAGDEGLCVAYESVEFLAPPVRRRLRRGPRRDPLPGLDEPRGRARAIPRHCGAADGGGEPLEPPVLAARAVATIVVGTQDRVAAAAGPERGAGG